MTLPAQFTFKGREWHEFEHVLGWFDWSLRDQEVKIDLTHCRSSNYQALSLLLLYVWHLRIQGCKLHFELAPPAPKGRSGASDQWIRMGAIGWSQVLYDKRLNFKGTRFKPLIAIRGRSDSSTALSRAEEFTKGFNVEYEKTLQYVLSELLYNTMEHGQIWFEHDRLQVPSIIQFTWYERRNEISFIIADLGVGIKRHLEMAYPPFENDLDAIRYAIQPQVSGTFGKRNPYTEKNNAGVGLYISTNIVQKLTAEMHIVSGRGLLHVSPRDITGKEIETGWPGTFVLVTIKLSRKKIPVNLHTMMAEAREAASKEIANREGRKLAERLDLNVENYFGRYAENKEAAISVRDRKIIKAVAEGKSIMLDFANVTSAPHSFLSALLATPIKILGMSAYKRLKITNANAEIRETIDYILDENTSE